MTKQQVEKIVDEYLPALKWQLGLGQWQLTIFYERLNDNTMAKVDVKPGYQKMGVTIDPEQHDDETNVLQTLIHELLHAFHNGFDASHEAVLDVVCDDAGKILEKQHQVACEDTVRMIESLLDYLGSTPTKLARSALRKHRKA